MQTEPIPTPEDAMSELTILRDRAANLEQRLIETQRDADSKLMRAELKVEAIRAGIVDLDGLKLLDLSSISLEPSGQLTGGVELIRNFRAAKPWLFEPSFSSRPVLVPPSQSPRSKSAVDMTDEEYAAARAAVLRQLT